ncbi:MAG: type IV pilin [Candidatus Thermoplasmatota archaeon]|nr:type IV pilin [Candidatus Thermoplasmatota archaeon]
MRPKIRKANDAVSEVLGTALLLGMAVSLFSLLSLVVLAYPFTPSPPSVNLVGYIEDGTNVTLEHYGGESLESTTAVIVRIQDTYETINFTDCLDDENNNALWDLGEHLRCPVGDVTGKCIEVTVVDTNSNSIIMSGILQEAGTL